MSATLGQNADDRGRARTPLWLLILCLVVYLPGFFSLPPIDRDESRFAQASRQMFESAALPAALKDEKHAGGLLMPMVQDRPRLNKPPLIYWLQSASAAASTGGDPMRDSIWMYRIPSLLAAIAAVMLTWRIGVSMFGPRVGALGAALLAVCPVVVWEAHQARADMVLLAWTAGGMGALWKVWDAGSRGGRAGLAWPMLFWICVAGGGLTKGPITLMVAGLAVVMLCLATRRWGWVLSLRPVLGVGLLVLVCAPWIVAIAQKIGWSEYATRVYDETIGRSLSSKEGHWGPPGYHLVLLVALFWPGSLLTGMAVMDGWKASLGALVPWRWRGTPGDPVLFCLAWAVPSWIVFEATGTKLPHYVLPLYPALALLSARAVLGAVDLSALRSGFGAIARWAWAAMGIGLVLGPAIVVAWGGGVDRVSAATGLAACVAAAAGVAYAAIQLARGSVARAQWAGIAAAVLWGAGLVGVLLPRASAMRLSSHVVASVEPLPEGTPLAAVGYHEDSLVFLSRGRVERLDEPETGAWWARHPGGVMVIPTDRESRSHTVLARVEGFNYSRGKWTRLSVVRMFRPAPAHP